MRVALKLFLLSTKSYSQVKVFAVFNAVYSWAAGWVFMLMLSSGTSTMQELQNVKKKKIPEHLGLLKTLATVLD